MIRRDLDDARRAEQVAFGRTVDWETEADHGAVFFGPEKSRQFPPLPVGNAADLLEAGLLDAQHRHNDAPPSAELVEWARSVGRRYRAYQFEIGLIGYVVGPAREDSRVAFEGVSIRSAGPIPGDLKGEVAARFDPDLLVVDDFRIELLWD